MNKHSIAFFACCLLTLTFRMALAQDNSPYSRYGLGDLVPSQNILSRGMGGLSIAYSDYGLGGLPFSINIVNPAALGNISKTKNFSNAIFDVGAELDYHTLRSTSSTNKFQSKNLVISYLQMAFPISGKKLEKKGMSWAVSLGLRPQHRISYKLEDARRIPGVDSIRNLYEGSGGVQQFNLSTGFKITGKGKNKNEFLLGLSSGYTFGNRNISTKTNIENDSVQHYNSNVETLTNFGGVFAKLGFQYLMNFSGGSSVRLGGVATLQQKLNAKQTTINQTFGYDYLGIETVIDSISYKKDNPGKIIYPVSFGFGMVYQSKSKQWTIGAEGEMTKWSDYLFFGEQDYTQDQWTIRSGAEYYPASGNNNANRFVQYIKYRAGMYLGPDYIKIKEARNVYAITAGLSIPLTTPRIVQTRGDFVSLNASLETGARGNKTSYSFRETFTRVNVGISMNARWFQKRIYD